MQAQSLQRDLLRADNINRELNPVTFNIAKSFSSLQKEFWKLHENFLNAPLVDNFFFLRAAPERRRPARGCIDRNLLGQEFYDRNKDQLRTLRMSCILRGVRIVSHDLLNRTTGLDFSQATYMHLSTAAAFAVTKYAGKTDSNGTSLPLNWLLQKVKRGSKRFRNIIERGKLAEHDISNLRVVKTFFNPINCPVPEKNRIQAMHGCWNWSFLGNRIRTFCFQFFNNSLSIGSRLQARYAAGGAVIDDRCTFCVKSGSGVPGRETFFHLFYDCPYLVNLQSQYMSIYLVYVNDDVSKKLGCIAGCITAGTSIDNFFILMTSIFFYCTIWQWKLMNKVIPSIATVCMEIDNHFDNAILCSNLVKNLATDSRTPVCRRWRERTNGRG
jgi:hypothetical protein